MNDAGRARQDQLHKHLEEAHTNTRAAPHSQSISTRTTSRELQRLSAACGRGATISIYANLGCTLPRLTSRSTAKLSSRTAKPQQ